MGWGNPQAFSSPMNLTERLSVLSSGFKICLATVWEVGHISESLITTKSVIFYDNTNLNKKKKKARNRVSPFS